MWELDLCNKYAICMCAWALYMYLCIHVWMYTYRYSPGIGLYVYFVYNDAIWFRTLKAIESELFGWLIKIINVGIDKYIYAESNERIGMNGWQSILSSCIHRVTLRILLFSQFVSRMNLVFLYQLSGCVSECVLVCTRMCIRVCVPQPKTTESISWIWVGTIYEEREQWLYVKACR